MFSKANHFNRDREMIDFKEAEVALCNLSFYLFKIHFIQIFTPALAHAVGFHRARNPGTGSSGQWHAVVLVRPVTGLTAEKCLQRWHGSSTNRHTR